jgi:hypothetical protein
LLTDQLHVATAVEGPTVEDQDAHARLAGLLAERSGDPHFRLRGDEG